MILTRFAKDSDTASLKDIEDSLPEDRRVDHSFIDALVGLEPKIQILLEDDKVVSYCVYTLEPGTQDIHIHRVSTHAEYQRRGHAYELVGLLIKKAKYTHEDCRLRCTIRESLWWQRNFFSACGFQIVEQLKTDIYLMEHLNPAVAIGIIKKRPRITPNLKFDY